MQTKTLGEPSTTDNAAESMESSHQRSSESQLKMKQLHPTGTHDKATNNLTIFDQEIPGPCCAGHRPASAGEGTDSRAVWPTWPPQLRTQDTTHASLRVATCGFPVFRVRTAYALEPWPKKNLLPIWPVAAMPSASGPTDPEQRGKPQLPKATSLSTT